MPRAPRKMMCASARPTPAPKKARAPKPVLTDDEKEDKKFEALLKREERKMKKDWEAALAPWKGADEQRVSPFALGTKVLFKSDAKKAFALNDKELQSLPFMGFAGSSKTVYSLPLLKAYADRRQLLLGIDYPARARMDSALPPTLAQPQFTMTVEGTRLTHLHGRPDKYTRMGF